MHKGKILVKELVPIRMAAMLCGGLFLLEYHGSSGLQNNKMAISQPVDALAGLDRPAHSLIYRGAADYTLRSCTADNIILYTV